MSEVSLSHPFKAAFLSSFVSNAKKFGCSLRSLFMQIYFLKACKMDWEENFFDFNVESIAFWIKVTMNVN